MISGSLLRVSTTFAFAAALACLPPSGLVPIEYAYAARAQATVSRPVVQPLPSQDTQRLNRALVELAKAPRSLPALLEAGNAALAVNDLESALGFFKRLTDLEPENEPGTLGLARVYLRSGRPVMALLYFDAAQSRGAGPLAVGSDQALTYDLLGDQAAAQEAYRTLIEASPKDEEARRRLALSYAISGNEPAFEATLRPLIERRDFAAFRARTFGLAILGKQERAAAIAEAVMPRALSQQITPYLEFMPRLTSAQQAAAANLGVFPRAADIGRDAPGVLAYKRDRGSRSRSAQLASAQSLDARLEPSGKPLGKTDEPPAKQPAESPTFNIEAEKAAPGIEIVAAPERVADAFRDMEQRAPTAPVTATNAAAVDIAGFEAPREPPPQPKEPEHPSRIWVQVATGQDIEALRFDWRRIRRKAPDLLKKYNPHTVPWGQANRLLAGPLSARQEARDLINGLNRKGIDSFGYTSPEGLEIQELKSQ